jgi:hypothetical protein
MEIATIGIDLAKIERLSTRLLTFMTRDLSFSSVRLCRRRRCCGGQPFGFVQKQVPLLGTACFALCHELKIHYIISSLFVLRRVRPARTTIR